MVQQLRALGIQDTEAATYKQANEPDVFVRESSTLKCSVISPSPLHCFSFTENNFFHKMCCNPRRMEEKALVLERLNTAV